MEQISILAIFAHPDDEAFRCGGTLALFEQNGFHVHILTFTRGQAGSCGQPPLCRREELGAVRTKELYCSCQALGLETPQVLDYEDGALQYVSQEEGVARIATCIQSIRPCVLLTWPLDGLSGHLDHQSVSRWSTEAFLNSEKSGYHVLTSLYYLAFPSSLADTLGMSQLHATPDSNITISVDIESVWEKKMAAIYCHRTQICETPILNASEEKQHLFFGKEYFIRLGQPKGCDYFSELLRHYAPV
ncbi:MAG: PIG-L deacetylase family protein [Anaerolineaceae bacterium]